MSAFEAHQLAEFSRAVRESTLKRLRRVPAGKENWRLTEESMSFADVAKHLCEADHWLFKHLQEGPLQPLHGAAHVAPITDRSDYLAILDELEETGRRRAALLESMTAGRLSERLFDHRFGGPVTVWWIIVRGNLDHEIHHRGHIAACLQRLAGES
jgi:uncharacterized damage-inducible protein DinB